MSDMLLTSVKKLNLKSLFSSFHLLRKRLSTIRRKVCVLNCSLVDKTVSHFTFIKVPCAIYHSSFFIITSFFPGSSKDSKESRIVQDELTISLNALKPCMFQYKVLGVLC